MSKYENTELVSQIILADNNTNAMFDKWKLENMRNWRMLGGHLLSTADKAKLAKEFRNALGLARIAPRTDLYELKATKASTLYLETHFHDNPEDATQLHESLPFLASLIATQLLKYGNKK